MRKKITAALILTNICALFCLGQGTFQNLNFESATVVRGPNPQAVPFAVAFPGWQGYFGSDPANTASYNNLNLGTSGFSLLDNQSPFGVTISNSTAVLQAGVAGFQPDVALAQTALVPTNTLSLRFFLGADPFIVSMNGQPLAPVVLQSFGLFNEYAADVSSFAGQTAELRFTLPANPNRTSGLILDEISFSTAAIPEPGTWALLGLGSVLFWCAARRRRK